MKRLFCLWSLFLGLTPGVLAQGSGKITGIVTDASTGEPLVGATIMIEGTRYGAAADPEGRYVLINLPSGAYTVMASAVGYTKTAVKNVQVSTALTTTLNIHMQPSAIVHEEVVIVAEAPMIKKDLTATESRVTSNEIRNLPLQNLTQLVSQQAGVSKDAGGGIHIRGGRSTEVSYLVNGISITDDYSRSQALEIETESIQELQVISGTFNAEYGNSLSGVVNILTKTGGAQFHGGIEAWSGDYISSHKNVFWGIDKFSPAANYNLQTTVSGPIYSDKAAFFLTGRRTYNDGWIYGINAYRPQGRTIKADSSFVSMNSDSRWSGQATLDWQISGGLKAKVDALGSTGTNRFYDRTFRLNPDGIGRSKNSGVSVIAKITHQLWQNTFQEFTFAYKYNETATRVYDNPFDPRYVHPDSLNVPGYRYRTAGTNLNRFARSTKSLIGKWDLTSQLDRYNLPKLGIEVQTDQVFYENILLVPARTALGREIVPFVPSIDGLETTNHDMFTRTPFKIAAYAQDKIELENMIINIGLRFEMFDPNGRVPIDAADPDIYSPFKLEHRYRDLDHSGQIESAEETPSNIQTVAERETYWYKKTSRKISLSPRLGIAYPITDKGIIRFSYGIFEQIPEYSQLYMGDRFKLVSAQQGVQGVLNDRNVQVPYGNNDLKPQRSTIYELGLQQQITDAIAIDVTGFYRDIRDWISSSPPIPTFLAGLSYSKRINRDFANVRGVTLAVKRKLANNFSFSLDYTFQIADGTNSTPDQEFFSQQNGSEPTKTLAPLSWDQTHTLNGTIFIGSQDQGVSIVAGIASGQPYTPTRLQGTITGKNVLAGLVQNSARKPSIVRFDVEAFKNISLAGIDCQIFLRAFNVFDRKNPINVFGDTGLADYTLEQTEISGYDPGWFDVPTNFSEPRSVFLGTKISL